MCVCAGGVLHCDWFVTFGLSVGRWLNCIKLVNYFIFQTKMQGKTTQNSVVCPRLMLGYSCPKTLYWSPTFFSLRNMLKEVVVYAALLNSQGYQNCRYVSSHSFRHLLGCQEWRVLQNYLLLNLHTGRSLTENTKPDAVLIQFDLLMMSTELLEICRGLSR